MIVRAFEGREPRLGKGVFVAENAALIGDVELEEDVSIWYGTVLRADIYPIRVGARTNIQDNCVLHVTGGSWPTIIKEEVTLGHSVVAHGCVIERRCLIGIGSRILDGAHIGEESVIGAGAVVTEGMEVPPRSLVLGVPGKVRRSVTPEEIKRLDETWRHYIDYKNRFLAG